MDAFKRQYYFRKTNPERAPAFYTYENYGGQWYYCYTTDSGYRYIFRNAYPLPDFCEKKIDENIRDLGKR